MQDPRNESASLPDDDRAEKEKYELEVALDIAQADAGKAAALLEEPLVRGYFEETINRAFFEFCELPESATVEQYRAVHLEAKAVINLRDKLKGFITNRNNLVEMINKDYSEEEY